MNMVRWENWLVEVVLSHTKTTYVASWGHYSSMSNPQEGLYSQSWVLSGVWECKSCHSWIYLPRSSLRTAQRLLKKYIFLLRVVYLTTPVAPSSNSERTFPTFTGRHFFPHCLLLYQGSRTGCIPPSITWGLSTSQQWPLLASQKLSPCSRIFSELTITAWIPIRAGKKKGKRNPQDLVSRTNKRS